MIFIPEVQLYTVLEQILNALREDLHLNEATPKNSVLYDMFGEVIYGERYNLYEQAVTIFTRKKDDPRLLLIRYFFDITRSKLPTIHITCPAEMPGETNSIGTGYDENQIDQKQGTWKEVFKHSFNPTYQIVITSDNPAECLVIYTVMKTMLISLFSSISLAGLENPSISSQELSSESVPPEVMMKAINLKVNYEMQVPSLFNHQIGKGLTFKGSPIPGNS